MTVRRIQLSLQGIQRSQRFFQYSIFLAAFLLFSVQPVISKYMLPWFGGSPSVWITAMLFFQALLLFGYLYVRVISKVSITKQVVAYGVVLFLAVITLPIEPAASWQPAQAVADPTSYIFLLLAASVGLPYIVLSAASPLIQAWFNRLHPQAATYRLYSWSNAGSLAGLLAYPIIVEPLFNVQTQANLWSVFFICFAAGISILAVYLIRMEKSADRTQNPSAEIEPKPQLKHHALWILLAFLGSLILLATTNYVTQDIASVPLLWVIPLSIYLVSFILTFDSERFYDREFFIRLFLAATVIGVFIVFKSSEVPILLLAILCMIVLAVFCIVCHGELYALRPHPHHLTAYYVSVALGGALGGIFVVLIAPRIFPMYFEFHLSLALICATIVLIWIRQKRWTTIRFTKLYYGIPLVVGLLMIIAANGTLRKPSFVHRDFFGSLRVFSTPEHRLLYHGRIVHGAQFKRDDLRCWPTTYYGYTSGLGQAVAALGPERIPRIGVVGLGAGTAAVYADYARFYELNPAVARLARDQFTYLDACTKKSDIILGDARISLEHESAQNFDVLILDAFSGDAVPVHLLTAEAMTTYLRHLKPSGLIAVHISNSFLDFKPIIGGLAQHFNLNAAVINSPGVDREGTATNTWALMSADKTLFSTLQREGSITNDMMSFGQKILWTDKYSNIIGIMRLK